MRFKKTIKRTIIRSKHYSEKSQDSREDLDDQG